MCRNGGLLPHECDIDIALWRPDSHWLSRFIKGGCSGNRV